MTAPDPVATLCARVEANARQRFHAPIVHDDAVLLVARLRQLELRTAHDRATIEHQSDTLAAVHACLIVGRVSEAVGTIRRACGGDADVPPFCGRCFPDGRYEPGCMLCDQCQRAMGAFAGRAA